MTSGDALATHYRRYALTDSLQHRLRRHPSHTENPKKQLPKKSIFEWFLNYPSSQNIREKFFLIYTEEAVDKQISDWYVCMDKNILGYMCFLEFESQSMALLLNRLSQVLLNCERDYRDYSNRARFFAWVCMAVVVKDGIRE